MKTRFFTLLSILIALLYSLPIFAQVNEDDSIRLVTFYERTNGDNWNNNQGWLTAEVSEWYGITVNEEGRVSMMQLSNNQLSGDLDDLRNVLPTALIELDLSNNSLQGKFDAWYPRLSELEILRINNNQLTSAGTGPTLGEMRKLRIFNASDNQLAHEFPNIISRKIEEISLSNNKLGGSIPDFRDFKNLKSLHIDNNYFSHATDGISLPAHIEHVSLENNRFNFQDIWSLTNALSLSETQVSYAPQKPFPLNLDTYNQLYIDCRHGYQHSAKVYRNGFLYEDITDHCGIWLTESGNYQIKVTHETLTNPDVLSQNLILESNTLNVDLSNPHIVDSVTLVNIYQTMGGENWHEIYTSTWLQTPLEEWAGVDMHSGGNGVKRVTLIDYTETPAPMVGALPAFNFNNLESVMFRDNNITGPLPKLPETIINFRANNNHLQGNLEVFNNMPNLESIFLVQNEFSGFLPTLEGSPKVNKISLDHNHFTGNIPEAWNDLGDLDEINLMGCNLSGSIALNEMPQLRNANLRGNRFTKVETDFTQFPNLESMELNSNDLTFDGLEQNASLPDSILRYEGQEPLNINYDANAGKLFVAAGGTPSNNSYTWTLNGDTIAQNVGDSTLAITEAGRYRVWVTNSVVTKDSLTAVAETENQYLILSAQADINPSDCWAQDVLTLHALVNKTGSIHSWNNGADTTWFTDKPMNEWTGITMSEDGCSIQALYLGGIGLNGILPYLNFSDLRHLNIGGNPELQGTLTIENITSLETLTVGGTKLFGTLPDFSKLPNLQGFSAVVNDFSGEIPSLDGLTQLTQFEIYCPNITGEIPSLADLSSLENLMISGTQITGSIPDLSHMTNLENLQFENNELSGQTPDLSTLNNLQHINFSNNYFNFDDLRENVVNLKDKNITSWKYAPQKQIEIHCDEQMLYVSEGDIGGNEEENTYTWIWELFDEEIQVGGDSSFVTVENGGWHRLDVTNSIVTNPDNSDQNLVLTGWYSVQQVEDFCKQCPIKAHFLDLPNEAVLCEGNTITFNAPQGMESYIWDFNGEFISENNSVDITTEGWLHLGVLDSCGNADIDSVQVRFGNDLECGCIGEDCVWPGAINKDGVVNHYDLMGIGFAYEETGPSRSNASLNFEGQAAENWMGSFAETMEGFEGRNHKHADCDGNGVINRDDVAGIKKNYQRIKGKTGAGLSKIQSGGTPISVETAKPINLGNGQWQYDFSINLGNMEQSAAGVYFFAFSSHIVFEGMEGDILHIGTPEVSYNDSWLGALEDNMIALDTFFMGENRFDIAVTKIDKQGENGFGTVARISDVIEVGPLLKTADAEPPKVKLLLSEIALLSKDGKIQDVEIDDNEDTTTSNTIINQLPLQMGVYPNPASSTSTISFASTPELPNTLQLTLSNVIGQTVWQGAWTKQMKTTALEVQYLSEGIYFLHAIGTASNGKQYVGNQKVMVKR